MGLVAACCSACCCCLLLLAAAAACCCLLLLLAAAAACCCGLIGMCCCYYYLNKPLPSHLTLTSTSMASTTNSKRQTNALDTEVSPPPTPHPPLPPLTLHIIQVIVVGGGIAGLACAAALKKARNPPPSFLSPQLPYTISRINHHPHTTATIALPNPCAPAAGRCKRSRARGFPSPWRPHQNNTRGALPSAISLCIIVTLCGASAR